MNIEDLPPSHNYFCKGTLNLIIHSSPLLCGCLGIQGTVYVIQSLLVGLMSICLLATIEFLRARANIHTVLGGQHVYCIQGNNGLESSY